MPGFFITFPLRRLCLSGTVSLIFLVSLAGCATKNSPTDALSANSQAANQATALIQNAEATALMSKAQVQATSILLTANAPANTPPPSPVPVNPDQVLTPNSSQTIVQPIPTNKVVDESIKLFGVHIGGDGGFIAVEFSAPPAVAAKWYDGTVYVIDESSGIIYKDIPVMEVIGPLFAKPKLPGQGGYVMFYNTNNAIKPGSVLTVVLGDFKQEHVIVQ